MFMTDLICSVVIHCNDYPLCTASLVTLAEMWLLDEKTWSSQSQSIDIPWLSIMMSFTINTQQFWEIVMCQGKFIHKYLNSIEHTHLTLYHVAPMLLAHYYLWAMKSISNFFKFWQSTVIGYFTKLLTHQIYGSICHCALFCKKGRHYFPLSL